MSVRLNAREPGIDDYVIITKSFINWNYLMNQYVGQVYKIKAFDAKGYAIFDSCPTSMRAWGWSYADRHYRLSAGPVQKKKLKIRINFKA